MSKHCRKPIVTAVQGITFTVGIEMMLARDIAVAAEDAEGIRSFVERRGAMFKGN